MGAPVVIVGSGLAGYAVARELRKRDASSEIVIVTADGGEVYSKPMLSNAFAQGKEARALISASAEDMARQHGLRVVTRTRVNAIDRAARVLETTAGAIAYGRLVLALGADPVRLPLAGDAADAVLSVNDLDDYARLRERLAEPRRRVAIIGGGLIGCEFANDLLAAGHAPLIIDPMAQPLASLVPQPAGESLRVALERAGVQWHLGRSVQRVDRRADGGFTLTLSDGTQAQADVALSAVGLRPRIGLAQAAGLRTERGIHVDRFGRTSDPDIFAIGDCAAYEGTPLPYVMPLVTAARSIAQTLAGTPTEIAFPVMPVVVKTPALPIAVVPAPRDASGRWESAADDVHLRLVYRDERDRIRGFALTGSYTAELSALTRQMG